METKAATNLKFGKLVPPKRPAKPALQFGAYVMGEGLPVPPATSHLSRLYSILGTSNPATLFPMDDNDAYNDCTIAALAHCATMWAGYTGRNNIPSAASCLSLYEQLTGGRDSGLYCFDVVNYVTSNSVLGEQPILGYVEVDPANPIQVQQAISVFGPLYAGFRVDSKTMSQFTLGQPWDGSGVITGAGHCVPIVDYGMNGLLTCLTWGTVQMATWSWVQWAVDEIYAIVPADAAATNYEPGYNMQQLIADLQSVEG
jgi:hypothetical protein